MKEKTLKAPLNMFHIKIITTGKIKESWLISAIEEYEKRLTNIASISWIILKNDKELEKEALKEKAYVCLDVNGKLPSSLEFSKTLITLLEKEGSSLCLIIGGPDGLSSSIKKKALDLISLSRLTFTHQITRLILIEQLYRAFEIYKGSSYHK
jgi:23S rRNA (pseudouridine1915-N3)-methyltransferase